MHLSSNTFNLARPNAKINSTTSDYPSLSPQKPSNIKIVSIQSNSLDISSIIPSHDITYTNSSLTYTFLSYKSHQEPQNQVTSFLTNIGFETQNLITLQNDSEFSIENPRIDKNCKTLIIDLKNPTFSLSQLKLKLSASITQNPDKHSLRIEKKIETEKIEILPYLNLFTKELQNFENEDKFLLNCIKTELIQRRKRNVKFEEGCIKFIELNSYFDSMRIVEVLVTVRNQVIRFEYKLNHDDYLNERALEQEKIEKIKKYLKEINENLDQGRFYWSDKICFSYFYHSFINIKENMNSYLLIQNDLDLINLHIPQFQLILNGKEDSISQIIELGKHLKPVPKLKFKHFQLTSGEVSKTLAIIERLNTKKDLFLSSRFNHKRIIVNPNENILSCPVPSQFIEFETIVQDHPVLVVQSINDLIEELAKIGLFFINCIFPLHQFIWYEEKPVFNYSTHLHELLTISNENPKKFLYKTKESVLSQFIEFNSVNIEKNLKAFELNEARDLIDNFELRVIEESQISQFSAMNQSNHYLVSDKLLGICKLGNEKMLIYSGKSKKSLLQSLHKMKFRQRLEAFSQIFELIQMILTKNSEISCIDLECLVLEDKNKLKINLKPQHDVLEEFKAPEVRNGRKGRAALIYSFGKITQVLFEDLKSGQKGWELVQEIVQKCTVRIVPRRISVEKLRPLVKNVINSFL